MNDSTIAFRAKEQLGKFLGKVFTHFSKPRKKFLADMLYGIQASEDALAETRQGPGVRELCDRGRTQTCLHAVREMVPQDHQPGTRANRERAAGVPPGIQGTVRSRPLLKSVECELRSAKFLKFCGAVAGATPLGVPHERKTPIPLVKTRLALYLSA